MRYDAEHRARTRERILQEAALAVRREGPERLGIVDVMKRVGLTHGGFYVHFKSSEDMLAATLAEMFGAARAMFDRRTEGLGPREALKAYVTFYVSREHRDVRETSCLLPLLSGDAPRSSPAVREYFAQAVAGLTGAMADKLRQLGHADPEGAAGDALTQMVGAVALARAVGSGAQSDDILARARCCVLARLGLEDC